MGLVLQNITYSNYLQQWILCILGFVLVALGVSIEVMAKLITNAGEGVVLSICKVCPIKFGNMKVIFDITLVCVSVSIGMIGLGHLDGVREGTVAAALFVGMITKQFSKPLAKLKTSIFSDIRKNIPDVFYSHKYIHPVSFIRDVFSETFSFIFPSND